MALSLFSREEKKGSIMFLRNTRGHLLYDNFDI
jgi:hypothetical protein